MGEISPVNPGSLEVKVRNPATTHLEVFPLTDFVPEDPNSESPFKFFHHKNNPDQRAVLLVDIPTEYQPQPTDEKLKPFWFDWEVEKNNICLDLNTVEVIRNAEDRKARRQFLIVEGEPARTKTFGIWAHDVVTGSLYYRDQFSSDTKDYHILGRRVPDTRKQLKMPVDGLLSTLILQTNPQAKEYAELLQGKRDKGEKIEDWELEVLGRLFNFDVFDTEQYQYEETMAMFCLKHGITWAADEPDVAPTKVFDGAVPLFEQRLKVFENRRHPDGRVVRHVNFWPVFCQNGPEYSNRNPLSAPILSRAETEKLRPLSQEDIATMTRFFITGNNPVIEFPIEQNGRVRTVRFRGEQNLPTNYRQLEQILDKYIEPFVEQTSDLIYTLKELVKDGTIGSNTVGGGNYVVDQRDVEQVLKSIIKSVNGGMTVPGTLEQETDLRRIIQHAYGQVFIKGLQDEDKAVLTERVGQLPLWSVLKKDPTANNWLRRVGGNVTVEGDENSGLIFS